MPATHALLADYLSHLVLSEMGSQFNALYSVEHNMCYSYTV